LQRRPRQRKNTGKEAGKSKSTGELQEGWAVPELHAGHGCGLDDGYIEGGGHAVRLEKMKIDDGDKESVARMTTMLINLHTQSQDQLCRTAVVNKYGFQAVGRIFEQTTDFEALTAEQQRALQPYTKEQQESGGQWRRNSGNRQKMMAPQDQAQGSMGLSGWPGQMAQQQQFWGWQS
jgi:hypothetical protein